jgi:ABC-type branched-subunit amino acid transport system permease subunit
MLMRRGVLFVVLAALLCAAPLVMGNYQTYLAQLMMINIVAALGLNLLTGNCGQISLCHSSFMAIGAYTTSLLIVRMGLSFAIAVPTGTVLAALLGACLGFPARRLSGLYLALVTLGFLELVQIGIEEFPELTGGVRGLSVPKPEFLGVRIQSDAALYYLVLATTALAVIAAYNVERSRFGRAFNAVRQSSYAAQSLGIPLARIKLLAFSIAAGFAGLSGGLQAIIVGFIDPTEFGISTSLRQITFIVVGGLGSVLGSIIGAVALTGLPELLRGAQEYSDLVYGAILLGALLFMPQGIRGLLGAALSRVQDLLPVTKSSAELRP